MVPSLINAIKSEGLVLVTDRSTEQQQQQQPAGQLDQLGDPFPRLPEGIDGILRGNGVLRFNESIDV